MHFDQWGHQDSGPELLRRLREFAGHARDDNEHFEKAISRGSSAIL